MTVAEIIVQARIDLGWSQRRLAEAVGVRERTVQRWEAGLSRPRNAHLLRLARVLGVDPEQLR